MAPATSARPLANRIVRCRKCPRLIDHCRDVARVKRRAYRDETYWGKPVATFGAANPRLFVLGLAPGAHGANRTGRVFTGDSSGDWLYRALFEAGFANQPESTAADDGLKLIDAAVGCAVRCAPPQNKPAASERDTCLPWLVEELRGYRRLAVVIALGRFAFDALGRAWPASGRTPWEDPQFAHGRESSGSVPLITSYHPSRQNTQTGRLTREMFAAPFARARNIVDAATRSGNP
jgi:uracil-DNA glycosylase family 4